MNTQDEVITPIMVTMCFDGSITETMSRRTACNLLYAECTRQGVTISDGSSPARGTVGMVSDTKAAIFATMRHVKQLLKVG